MTCLERRVGLVVLAVSVVLWCGMAVGQPMEVPRVLPPAPEESPEEVEETEQPVARADTETGKRAQDTTPTPEGGKGAALPDLPLDDDQEGGEDDAEGGETDADVEEPAEALPKSTDCVPLLPSPARTKLVKAIDQLLASKKMEGSKVGVLAVTYPEGEVLYERNSTQLFNPASVTKIFTSVAVLLKLGTGKKYGTAVYREPGACGALVVKGGGDPGLMASKVAKLAGQVRSAGVGCVAEVRYDVGLFDGKNLPPAFDQQKGPEGYRAKVGALGMEYGAFWLNAYPTLPGQAARLETDPPTTCVQWDNRAVTAEPGEKVGADKALSATVNFKNDKVYVVVKGRIPTNRTRGVSLSLAVPDPDWFTACYLAEQLRLGGVQVQSAKLEAGRASAGAVKVAEVSSNSMGSDVVEMSRNSRNYMAEQMVKLLSEGRCKKYSFDCGLKVVRQVMRRFHMGSECAVLKNGSGLFDANRVSPVATVRFLTEVLNHGKVRGGFIKSLAQGQKSGTLKDRMKGVVLPVVAKTGTLDSVAALAGYILRKDGGYVVFAIYFNGGKGAMRQRTVQDELVGKLAQAVAGMKEGKASKKSEKKHKKSSRKGKRKHR